MDIQLVIVDEQNTDQQNNKLAVGLFYDGIR